MKKKSESKYIFGKYEKIQLCGETHILLTSCLRNRFAEVENGLVSSVLPAGVVGGGGPGPGGQRRARHQDHPVEQHPWT